MKLRNKKTGEVVDAYSIDAQYYETIIIQYFNKNGVLNHFSFDSLEELNNILEDYKPAEPLIEDEKIRKAVRAWAEALKENTIRFDRISQGFSFGDGNVFSSINFDGFVFDLVDGKKYTIAELCGEEEE